MRIRSRQEMLDLALEKLGPLRERQVAGEIQGPGKWYFAPIYYPLESAMNGHPSKWIINPDICDNALNRRAFPGEHPCLGRPVVIANAPATDVARITGETDES